MEVFATVLGVVFLGFISFWILEVLRDFGVVFFRSFLRGSMGVYLCISCTHPRRLKASVQPKAGHEG